MNYNDIRLLCRAGEYGMEPGRRAGLLCSLHQQRTTDYILPSAWSTLSQQRVKRLQGGIRRDKPQNNARHIINKSLSDAELDNI